MLNQQKTLSYNGINKYFLDTKITLKDGHIEIEEEAQIKYEFDK